jgi:hypothetical protein
MMGKEVRFSAMRISSRLAAKSEARYSADETDLVMPAFLRKKSQEGKGRKQSGTEQQSGNGAGNSPTTLTPAANTPV